MNAIAKITNYSESNAFLWEYFRKFAEKQAKSLNKTKL